MQELYRMLPKVDFFMQSEPMRRLTERYGREAVITELRARLEHLRNEIREEAEQKQEEGAGRGREEKEGDIDREQEKQEEAGGRGRKEQEEDIDREQEKQEEAGDRGRKKQEEDIDREQEKQEEAGGRGREKQEEGAGREAGVAERIRRLPEEIADSLRRQELRGFHHVINATGTVLHTNLGRAPLSEQQAEALAGKLWGYSNLEYDLAEGRRGERYSHFEALLTKLTGAEAAVAVNNNAAAVLLILSALSFGKEVIVSRGEQIEIGGKFRIPEVIEQGGAVLREVGTTNKTHREDYVRALNENTGAILKVHTSNYRIEGFTESVPVPELTGLGVPVIEDLGSGVLVNLEEFELRHEPTVQEAVRSGADVVCFSGDKLLGGPQAGIIVGKRAYIERIKAHPLMRAVRIGKFTAAALELVLREYAKDPGQAAGRIPALRMLRQSREQLWERAGKLLGLVEKAAAAAGESQSGQGCVPEADGACRSLGCMPEADGACRSLGCVPEADGACRSLGCVPEAENRGRQESGTNVQDMRELRIAGWRLRVSGCLSEAGGGSLPGQTLPSAALVIRGTGSVQALQDGLRTARVPVAGRITRDQLWLDMRTVFEEELPILAEELAAELAKKP